jgi:hypothetical protein
MKKRKKKQKQQNRVTHPRLIIILDCSPLLKLGFSSGNSLGNGAKGLARKSASVERKTTLARGDRSPSALRLIYESVQTHKSETASLMTHGRARAVTTSVPIRLVLTP